MSKVTSDSEKKVFIEKVINKLNEIGFQSEKIQKLSNEIDLKKQYKKAQTLNRTKQLGIEGRKSDRFAKSKHQEEVKEETNEDFIREIEKADESSLAVAETAIEEVETEVIKESSKGIEILRKALDYGVNTFQLDFIKGNSISVEYVGNKDDKNVYYCSDIESFIIVA